MATLVNESMASSPLTGTIKDDASWDSGGFLIAVTDNTIRHGEFEYTDSGTLGTSFTVTFDFKVHPNAGSGGDAVYFYFGDSSTPGDEDGNYGGYSINYDDYSGDFSTLQLNFQGSRLADDNTVPTSTIADGNWHTAKIVVALPNIQVWLDGTKYIDFTDSTRTLGGSLFGWGARCGGGAHNEHDIKNLLVTTASAGATGRPKVWNGSSWVQKPLKVWSGSAWVEKPVKVWNGSSWVEIT